MSAPGVGLVLLAAGQGHRMEGPNKLLADLHGRPVVRWSAAALARATGSDGPWPGAPRVMVTGRDAAAVASAVEGLGFSPVVNRRFSEGMGTSLAAGVAALQDDVAAVLIALGDMPGLTMDTLWRLATALATAPQPARAIVRPVCGAGRPGHPVLWGAAHRAALGRLTGDQGGRDLIREQAAHLVTVPVDDPAIHADIDRPDDLLAARSRLPPAAGPENLWSSGGVTS